MHVQPTRNTCTIPLDSSNDAVLYTQQKKLYTQYGIRLVMWCRIVYAIKTFVLYHTAADPSRDAVLYTQQNQKNGRTILHQNHYVMPCNVYTTTPKFDATKRKLYVWYGIWLSSCDAVLCIRLWCRVVCTICIHHTRHTATHCNTLQHTATHCNSVYYLYSTRRTHCIHFFCSVLQCVAVCCSVLQCVAVCCSVLHIVYTSFDSSHKLCTEWLRLVGSFKW